MPDLFNGDTAPATTAIDDDSTSLLEQIKLKTLEVSKAFLIDMWMARISADRIMSILHQVIDAAHEQYPDAVTQGGGIYAVGYCVGARYVLLLAKGQGGDDESAAASLKGPYIKAGALAHAASVVPDDFKDLKAPLSMVCIENDPLFPDAVRSAGEDALSKANLEHEVQVYPGVPHGESALIFAAYGPALTVHRVRCRGHVCRRLNWRCASHGLRPDAEMDPGPLTLDGGLAYLRAAKEDCHLFDSLVCQVPLVSIENAFLSPGGLQFRREDETAPGPEGGLKATTAEGCRLGQYSSPGALIRKHPETGVSNSGDWRAGTESVCSGLAERRHNSPRAPWMRPLAIRTRLSRPEPCE